MCGRFSLKALPDDLAKVIGAELPLGYRPRYNIAPSQEVLAVVREEPGERRARMLRWGLVPFWADDPAIGNRMINVRAETVAQKPAYRNAFRRGRCLVWADGFYEWRPAPGGKRPMRIHRRDDAPFCFAGLWERWERGGRVVESCAILTTSANATLRTIHDRMPVILERDGCESWLATETPTDGLLALLAEREVAELEAYPVSTVVNRPGNDLPECLERVEDEGEPPAGDLLLL